MSWLKNIGGALGYIIGALVVLPLIIFISNRYFIKENRAIEKYIKPFMQNAMEIQIKMPNTSNLPFGQYRFKDDLITTQLATKNMGRDASKRSKYYYQDIYSPKYNKNIRIVMFDLTHLFWANIGDSTVMLKVNKDDFNSSEYGTKVKPLICFSLRGANRTLTAISSGVKDSGKIYNIDTPPEQFGYNVYMYRTYIMPRKEFKERFEKGK